MGDEHRKRTARLTGLAYLGIILSGVFAEGIARGTVPVDQDPAATVAILRDNMRLFRMSIAADFFMLFCDLLVALLFFRLLRPFGQSLAATALVLRFLQAATILWGVTFLLGVFKSLSGGEDQAVYDALQSHGLIYDLGLIFFAGNCVIMAVLLTRSALGSKLIAWGLAASGLVYLTGSLTHLFALQWLAVVEPAYLIPLVTETALCLWLLTRGRI